MFATEFESREQRDLFDYMYDVTSLRYEVAAALWGVACQIAGDHPDWSFWKVLAEVRTQHDEVMALIDSVGEEDA
jgi:hypothetical protein